MLSGGGTLGPAVPLLAIAEIYSKTNPDAEFIWIGTKNGPEKELVETYGLKFIPIGAGKLRRYFSYLNILDFFKIFIAFFQSLYYLIRYRPCLVISAGGYVSVPLHFAAALLGIRSWIHQQDARVGMSNRLMAPLAKVITVALASNQAKFNPKKTLWLGNPIRPGLLQGDADKARVEFGLRADLPVVFVTGGGTGSEKVNLMVVEALESLRGLCQIVHLTGKERSSEKTQGAQRLYPDYHPVAFVTSQMKDLYAVADIVVSRGGFGTISEIAALGKAAIIIPKSGHQEENAKLLKKEGAVMVLDEDMDGGLQLGSMLTELLTQKARCQELGARLRSVLPPADPKKIIEVLNFLLKKS